MIRLRSTLGSLLILFSASCWSYGGGGGSSACEEPQFFTESPANNSAVASFSEFSFVASNVDPESLSVKINGTVVVPSIVIIPNGDLRVTVRPENPVRNPGRIQIAITAKNTDGCPGFKAYYIEVK